MEKDHLKITQGNSKEYQLTFTDKKGDPLNIKGWVVCFNIKTKEDHPVLRKFVKDHTDPITGKTSVSLTEGETNLHYKEYSYSIEVKTNEGKIQTVKTGRLHIVPNENPQDN